MHNDRSEQLPCHSRLLNQSDPPSWHRARRNAPAMLPRLRDRNAGLVVPEHQRFIQVTTMSALSYAQLAPLVPLGLIGEAEQ